MNLPVFPSLSADGWVTDSRKKADKLLSCFFASDYSQDYINYGDIKSLSYILALNYHDPMAFSKALEVELTELFSRYFHNVEVHATEVPNEKDPSHAAIKFSLMFMDQEGKEFDFVRLLEYEGMSIKNIIEISNG